jgi:hypothetical protein
VNYWAMTEAAVRTLLVRLVSGDTDALESLARVPQEQLMQSASGTELVVRAEAVAKVLRSLSARSIDAEAAQRWASFVRRGFFEGRSSDKHVKPISIDYDDAYEDAISEAVSRIDEIGDVIDGDVPDATETDLLLYSLGYVC